MSHLSGLRRAVAVIAALFCLVVTMSLPALASPAASPLTVTLDFDDGTADQYQIGAILAEHRMHGTFFVNSGRIGLSDHYMTARQVRHLQAAGNEIGGHTVYHLHLSQQSVAEQVRQICIDRNQLLRLGLRITDMAFPFGDYTAASQHAAEHCGYNSVRTSEAGDGGLQQLPPANPYALKALSSLGSSTTLDFVTQKIAAAEQVGGGMLQVVFHRMCTAELCRSNAIHLSVFRQVLDWLAAERVAGRIRITTVAGVIGGPVHAPVAAPRPTARLGVPNSSFEEGTTAADVPRCWEHTVVGDDNTATWSLTTAAHSGQWAEHLDAPAIVGGVGLVVTQDEGSCAAPADPGHLYTYGVWYTSTAPVRLIAYRRLESGGYRSFGLSRPFPASPTSWKRAEVTTKQLPEGSNGLSVGIAVKHSGQFTFDDFALVDSGAPPPPPPVANPIPHVSALKVPLADPPPHGPAPHGTPWNGRAIFAALVALAVLALVLFDLRLARIRHKTR